MVLQQKPLKLPKRTLWMLDAAGLVIWLLWFQGFVVVQLLIIYVKKQTSK